MANIEKYLKNVLSAEDGAEIISVDELRKAAYGDLLVSGLTLDKNDSLRPFVEFVDSRLLSGKYSEYKNVPEKKLFKVLLSRFVEGSDSEESIKKYRAFETELIEKSKQAKQSYNYASFYNFTDIDGSAEEKCSKTWDFYFSLIKALDSNKLETIPCFEKDGDDYFINIPGAATADVETEASTLQDYLIKSNMYYFIKACDEEYTVAKKDKNGKVVKDRKGNPVLYTVTAREEYKRLSAREKYAVSTLATNLVLRSIAREGEEFFIDDLVEQLNGALAYIINPRDQKNEKGYVYDKKERSEAMFNRYNLSDETLVTMAFGLAEERLGMFKYLIDEALKEKTDLTEEEKNLLASSIKVDLTKIRHDEGVKAQLERKVETIQKMAVDFGLDERATETDQTKFSYVNAQGHLLGNSDKKFVKYKTNLKELNKVLFKDEKADTFETVYKQLIVDFLIINNNKNLSEETKRQLDEAVLIPMIQGADHVDLDKMFCVAADLILNTKTDEFYAACLKLGLERPEVEKLQEDLKSMFETREAKIEQRKADEAAAEAARLREAEKDIILGEMMRKFGVEERQFKNQLKVYKKSLVELFLNEEDETLKSKFEEDRERAVKIIEEAKKIVKMIEGLGFESAEDEAFKKIAEMENSLITAVKEASELAEGELAKLEAEIVAADKLAIEELLDKSLAETEKLKATITEYEAQEAERFRKKTEDIRKAKEARAKGKAVPKAKIEVVTGEGVFKGQAKKVGDGYDFDETLATVITDKGSYSGKLERK